MGRISLLNFSIYYIAAIIKTVISVGGYMHRSMEQNTENTQMFPMDC